MPYSDGYFHFWAITNIFIHLVQSLINLLKLIYRLVITPFLIINPIAWFYLPGHCFKLLDNAAGTVISLLTLAVSPVFLAMRTLSSMIFGYEESDQLSKEEEPTACYSFYW